MGDVVAISTWPGVRNVFYRISSSAIVFEVKAATSPAIGLAKKPGNKCDIWVVIGHDNIGQRTWIKRDEGDGKTCRTPNIISETEYRRFWLSWRNGCIELGRWNEKNPIISYNNNMDLCYVTFSSGGRSMVFDRNVVHWKVELPPAIEKSRMKSVTGGDLQWVHADNHLPDGALIGGYEKETLYIIRAHHRGSLTPGKFVPSQGTGYIAWGGEANEKNEFEVLCGFDCTWMSTIDDRIPVGAVEGGYSEREREKLYVGRAFYNGHLIPGKIQPSHRVCYIPYEGREIGQKKFEILVSPDANLRSANRVFINPIDVESPPESDTEDDDPHELMNYEEMHDHVLVDRLL